MLCETLFERSAKQVFKPLKSAGEEDMKIYRQILSLLLGITLFSSSAFGDTIQTFGAGAVITVDGSADFESFAALYDNPYSEGGMLFSRTGLSFNNAGCGYASQDDPSPPSCSLAFPGFSGNYMYGVSTDNGGYFEITAGPGNTFRGLEFVLGSGFGAGVHPVAWASYDAGNNLITSGSFPGVMGTVVGFSDSDGFATLRYTSSGGTSADFSTTFNAPAFDTVRADFTQASTQSVPDSATTSSLFGIGIAGLLLAKYRGRKRSGPL
jgi:hypothetical protein